MMIMMITMMMCYMTICVLKSWLEANLLANSTIIIKTDVRENKKKTKKLEMIPQPKSVRWVERLIWENNHTYRVTLT